MVDTFGKVLIASVLLSPIIFAILQKPVPFFINVALYPLLLISWFWSIHYKLTPKLYLGEVVAIVMILSLLLTTLFSFYTLFKVTSGIPHKNAIQATVALVLGSFALTQPWLPFQSTSKEIYIMSNHSVIVVLFLFSTMIGGLIRLINSRLKKGYS